MTDIKMCKQICDNQVFNPRKTTIIPGVYYPHRKYRCHTLMSRYASNRIISRNGEINIEKVNSAHRSFNLFSGCFLSMVEMRWRWTFISFYTIFLCYWLLFAIVYWVIAYEHGDLTKDNLPRDNSTEYVWTPCVKEIYGFTSTLLFSIEVHTTVAYGKRSITLECPQAILAMCLQCIFSSIFQCFMVGILFAKLTRPKARSLTILFSKFAIVTMRNKNLCLMFRVGDMRKSRILNIKVSLFIIRIKSDVKHSVEGEQIKIDTELDGCESSFFLWPVTVIHVINEKSPLYNVSAADLISGEIEILAVFEGTIESTGQPVQARTSYVETEILWGRRFTSMIEYDPNKNVYNVDYSKLSLTKQVDIPLCSSNEYISFITKGTYSEG